ncbi:MAG: hypothetical protein IPJ06_18755 [Saprospiraceae bacterium]|nr:hypothetical protein [Saprospiraceae bacterium]
MKKLSFFFIPITLFLSVFMALTLLAPWISPGSFWPSLFAAHGYVYVFPCLVICLIYWLRPPRQWALLPAILIVFSLPAWHRHVQFGNQSHSDTAEGIVIATLNAYSLHELKLDKKKVVQVDREKSKQLFPKDMQPDIVCLQEIPLSYVPRGPDWGISNSYLFRHKNSLLVSRYPIKEKGKKSFEGAATVFPGRILPLRWGNSGYLMCTCNPIESARIQMFLQKRRSMRQRPGKGGAKYCARSVRLPVFGKNRHSGWPKRSTTARFLY